MKIQLTITKDTIFITILVVMMIMVKTCESTEIVILRRIVTTQHLP